MTPKQYLLWLDSKGKEKIWKGIKANLDDYDAKEKDIQHTKEKISSILYVNKIHMKIYLTNATTYISFLHQLIPRLERH